MADIPKGVYEFDPIYQGISTRFRELHRIDISKHIKTMLSVERRVEEGFNFLPYDAGLWESVLIRAGFQHDLREKHLGIFPSIGSFAALATHGEGYREKGSPSLHCAVAQDKCNVHLDNIGFRLHGYGPDAGQHVVDELAWQAIILPALGKVLPTPVIDFLHLIHPVVPNSRQIKPFSEIGLSFDVMYGRSPDLQRIWQVTLDVTHSCTDSTCDVWEKLQGNSVEGENKVMLWLKVRGQ